METLKTFLFSEIDFGNVLKAGQHVTFINGLMVNVLAYFWSGLAGDIVLCSWIRHYFHVVRLSTQVYKWVPTIGGLIPGGEKYSESLHATETGDTGERKRRPDGPLGSY